MYQHTSVAVAQGAGWVYVGSGEISGAANTLGLTRCPPDGSAPLTSCSPAAVSGLHLQHIAGTLLSDPMCRTRLAKGVYDSLYLTNCS